MTHLSRMDRASRAAWQHVAAHKRRLYQLGSGYGRSLSMVADIKFYHLALLKYARTGEKFEHNWWT